jgi:hypothetical protein
MPSKHVHFYPGVDFHNKDRGTQKIKIWKISPKTYYTDNHAYKKHAASHHDKRQSLSAESGGLYFFMPGKLAFSSKRKNIDLK